MVSDALPVKPPRSRGFLGDISTGMEQKFIAAPSRVAPISPSPLPGFAFEVGVAAEFIAQAALGVLGLEGRSLDSEVEPGD